jgi:hypothetical protein
MVDVLVGEDVILKVLRDEVIKRDTLEGPAAELAARRVRHVASSLTTKATGGVPPTALITERDDPSAEASVPT